MTGIVPNPVATKRNLLPLLAHGLVLALIGIIAMACGQNDHSPSKTTSIMVYVLSNKEDNSHWYKDPADLNPLKEVLEDKGYSVEIRDRVTLPSIFLKEIQGYEQIWILEGDWNSIVNVTEKEAEDLYRYYENGGDIWISFETTYPPDSTYGSWNEDALVFTRKFGVDGSSYATGNAGGKPVFSDYPLFKSIHRICFDETTGCLASTNNDIKVIWNYSPSCQGIAVLDGRSKGKGRAVFDSGWILGYTYLDMNDNLQLACNIADWLSTR
ncbi:MAG TPA: hypothetical protein VMY43_13150 [Methanothrix sp.]|nr:hypothetical protein [Methanothrix sp.]